MVRILYETQANLQIGPKRDIIFRTDVVDELLV